MNRLTGKDWAMMALVVVLILLPLFFVGIFVAGKHSLAQSQLEKLEPRYARLLGLGERSKEMDAELAKMNERISQFVYPNEMDATRAGNDAQQRVRSVLTTAGLTVVSSQVLPTKVEQGFERISISVRAESELIHLQAALAVLPSLEPVILVDGINIQVVGQPRAEKTQRLATELKLSVLHRKPA